MFPALLDDLDEPDQLVDKPHYEPLRKWGEKITKTRHNPSSITDFECKIPKYKNRKPLRKIGE